MKPFISTKFYGFINYGISFLLLLAPWYWGSFNGITGFYAVGGAALLLPLYFGWMEFIMAVFSNSKHGLIKQFPMQMHFILDVIMGSFLLASPFTYGFSEKVVWPHMIMGAILCIAGIFTQNSPFTTRQRHHMPEGQLGSVDSE